MDIRLPEQPTWITPFEEIDQQLGFFKGDLFSNNAIWR
jgi:hypothetical protein